MIYFHCHVSAKRVVDLEVTFVEFILKKNTCLIYCFLVLQNIYSVIKMLFLVWIVHLSYIDYINSFLGYFIWCIMFSEGVYFACDTAVLCKTTISSSILYLTSYNFFNKVEPECAPLLLAMACKFWAVALGLGCKNKTMGWVVACLFSVILIFSKNKSMKNASSASFWSYFQFFYCFN